MVDLTSLIAGNEAMCLIASMIVVAALFLYSRKKRYSVGGGILVAGLHMTGMLIFRQASLVLYGNTPEASLVGLLSIAVAILGGFKYMSKTSLFSPNSKETAGINNKREENANSK